jgi:hypothetical protein
LKTPIGVKQPVFAVESNIPIKKRLYIDGVIQEYDKNQEFYGKILQDDSFRNKLMDLIMLDIYSSFRDGTGVNM